MSGVWYNDPKNVLELAMWLEGECNAFSSPAAVVRFFEKPWKWAYEFAMFQFHQDDEYWKGREVFRGHAIDALIEEMSIEQVKAEIAELEGKQATESEQAADEYDYVRDDQNFDAAREDAMFGRVRGRD